MEYLNFVAEIHRMPRYPWQCLDFLGTGQFSPFLISDLHRPFCHPVIMVSLSVTPMHHPMSMGSAAVPRPLFRVAGWR